MRGEIHRMWIVISVRRKSNMTASSRSSNLAGNVDGTTRPFMPRARSSWPIPGCSSFFFVPVVICWQWRSGWAWIWPLMKSGDGLTVLKPARTSCGMKRLAAIVHVICGLASSVTPSPTRRRSASLLMSGHPNSERVWQRIVGVYSMPAALACQAGIPTTRHSNHSVTGVVLSGPS